MLADCVLDSRPNYNNLWEYLTQDFTSGMLCLTTERQCRNTEENAVCEACIMY